MEISRWRNHRTSPRQRLRPGGGAGISAPSLPLLLRGALRGRTGSGGSRFTPPPANFRRPSGTGMRLEHLPELVSGSAAESGGHGAVGARNHGIDSAMPSTRQPETTLTPRAETPFRHALRRGTLFPTEGVSAGGAHRLPPADASPTPNFERRRVNQRFLRCRSPIPATPAKQSFGDKCVPKLELGNAGIKRVTPRRRGGGARTGGACRRRRCARRSFRVRSRRRNRRRWTCAGSRGRRLRCRAGGCRARWPGPGR